MGREFVFLAIHYLTQQTEVDVTVIFFKFYRDITSAPHVERSLGLL